MTNDWVIELSEMVEMHWIDVCECEFKMVDVCVGA